MKDKKISFIAIGQAGGNIGCLFEKKGYNVLYLNTSQEDLDVTNGKYKYHISGGEGCNKDRHKAKKLIMNDFNNIYKEIASKVNAELIYIIFASGGGTGSGSSPMLAELLLQENKNIGLITILPDLEESVKTHINAYECFSEIDKINGLSSTFILDNKGKNKMSVNSLFVDAFCSFISIPEKHKSIKGIVDPSEIMETLSAQGAAIIVSADANGDLLKRLFDNIYAPLEKDEVVQYITASLAGKITIKDIEKTIGSPLDSFKTYNDNKTICCVSGLSFPAKRINEIYDIVNHKKDNIKRNLSSKKISHMKSMDFLNEFSIDTSSPKEVKNSLSSKDDIFKKYLK